jgi:hypothetical protein
MKKILFLSIIVLLSSCSGNDDVEVGQKTEMTIDNVVFDAGEVFLGEMITAKFMVTNSGSYPLVIAQVNASCSCTVAEKPDEPILPGQSKEIIAHVNTDKTGPGILNKSVRITANTSPAITQVKIMANVTRK